MTHDRFRTVSRRAATVLFGTLLIPAAALAAPGVPETRRLDNGLRIVLLEDHAVPLTAVSLWVGAGSKQEVEGSNGYAHYLEHLIQRGTTSTGPFE
ncbi:MAG TPA: insulinase family protein, partial [Candidatus Polarisedimenticolia bacterium]|nr:insulinase family protein [Candidatus Polarisedimenticolia bacterium]